MVESIKLENIVLNNSLDLDVEKTEYNILDSVDWGEIEASHHEYKYIGQNGVTIVGTSLGTRDIEIKGWVIANTEKEMTERKSVLNRFFSPLHLIKLYYSQYIIEFYCTTTIKYGKTKSENNEKIVHWVIDGIAPYPFFEKITDSRYYASYETGMFHFPLIIKNNNESLVFGQHKATTMFSANNYGHIPVGCRITFLARGGPVTNPKIINIDTQDYIQINKTLVKGEKVIIDTNKGHRTIYGYLRGEKKNYQKYKDLGSKWITLALGETNLNYSAESGQDLLDVYIDFNYAYQEVQECY